MDDADLRLAYAALAHTARAGTFDPPRSGEWTAAQVLAHVIVNDRAMCTVTAELLDDGEPSFSNEVAQQLVVLDAICASCDGLEPLIAEVERQGRELCNLVQRLDETLASRTVSVHLTDHGEVRLQGPLPWRSILDTHAQRHLPAHTEQLAALRTS